MLKCFYCLSQCDWPLSACSCAGSFLISLHFVFSKKKKEEKEKKKKQRKIYVLEYKM